MNETHTPYYNFQDWEVTQNDQVFQLSEPLYSSAPNVLLERLLALTNPCWSLPVGCPWFTEVESKALLPYTPLKVKIWR